MGGGLTDWHRQKRKKEQKKNKEKRIAERDAKVLETKTVASVQEEIRKLERHHKVKKDDDGNEIPLPHNIKTKLDRLKKELKILKQSDEEDNEKKPSKPNNQQNTKEWKPLDNPQLSVYYDPVMNPFGEPPPGQPRLYHTADGRTTFRLEEAALPGSRPPPPPPQPTMKEAPSSKGQSKPSHHHHHHRSSGQPRGSQHDQRQSHRAGQNEQRQSNRDQEQSAKSAPKQSSATTPPTTQTITGQDTDSTEVPKKLPPKQAPNLPPPSQAVKRGKKRLKADIWASNEEIDYHQHADNSQSHITLEGVVVDTGGANDGIVKEWWYEDKQGQIQGPFPHEQMLAWIKAGYFPPETRARPRPDAPWKPFHHYSIIRSVLPGAQNDTTHDKNGEQEESLQDRIASLRKQHQQTSVADRIAALRGNNEDKEQHFGQPNPDEEHDEDPGLPPPPPSSLDQNDETEMPVYPVPDDADMEENVVESSEHLPPPPAPGAVQELPAYLISGSDDNDFSLPPPPPPPPPPPRGGQQVEVPAYSISNKSGHEGTAEYPAPYPIADFSGEGGYPLGEEDVPVTDSYPVVDVYPAEEVEDVAVQPPVKKAKVDREVVSFLPTHLQKKRKK